MYKILCCVQKAGEIGKAILRKVLTKERQNSLKGLSSQNRESYFTYYEEFEGADHESVIYFCVSCMVSKL